MQDSRISVIIPSYNRAHILKNAVSSVLEQSYKNIELILVDDCSTDNTKEIAKEITDSRFRYHRLEKNSGACIARNKGIELAKGEYIAFNDSDDHWHKEKLQKQLDFLLRNKADITSCAMNVYDENQKLMYVFPDKNKTQEGIISTQALLKYNNTSTQLLFGKAECFRKIMFDPTMPRFQDWEECIRLSQQYSMYYQNEILVDTYQQRDSITKNPKKGLNGMKIILEKYRAQIFSSPDITESFFKKMSAFTCLCGKNPIQEMKYIVKACPNLNNRVRYILAKIGLYKLFFKMKNK